MSSVKRKQPPPTLLQRRVRPRYEPEPESDVEEISDAPSEEGAGFDSEEDEDMSEAEMRSGSDEENSELGSDPEDGEDQSEDDTPQPTHQLSFGALAKAQAALGDKLNKRKRRSSSAASEASSSRDNSNNDNKFSLEKNHKKPLEKPSRTSKHAPVELSSKRQVSRRRDFLLDPTSTKPQHRDPRFFAPSTMSATSKIDEIKARKAYAFLDEYREKEMQELRVAIKKSKNAEEKEKLQKALLSMESKKKAQERKDKAQKVLDEHKKKEKELVRQGKNPFYLKRSEQKKRVVVETFKGMKKGQVDRAIERRRKKVAGKEKKLLPWARRTVDDR
ncbi:rRNA biogenesis protein rrp36 [Podospora pseudocomata]|uniref:rRNA biogenesis protein RRP36 n=1 Tax=Podospora pseudocomata TaxID=2093779 RepID=A0ABR0GMT3_9PEZI|nr:rRNA biogenesis protein rrp36 [Podospora pseudocomata]